MEGNVCVHRYLGKNPAYPLVNTVRGNVEVERAYNIGIIIAIQ